MLESTKEKPVLEENDKMTKIPLNESRAQRLKEE